MRKSVKKLLAVCAIGASIFAFCGCGNDKKEDVATKTDAESAEEVTSEEETTEKEKTDDKKDNKKTTEEKTTEEKTTEVPATTQAPVTTQAATETPVTTQAEITTQAPQNGERYVEWTAPDCERGGVIVHYSDGSEEWIPE